MAIYPCLDTSYKCTRSPTGNCVILINFYKVNKQRTTILFSEILSYIIQNNTFFFTIRPLHWHHGHEKFYQIFSGLHQNVFLRTLEIHFTFDIWSKNPSITMKSWLKVTKVDSRPISLDTFVLSYIHSFFHCRFTPRTVGVGDLTMKRL